MKKSIHVVIVVAILLLVSLILSIIFFNSTKTTLRKNSIENSFNDILKSIKDKRIYILSTDENGKSLLLKSSTFLLGDKVKKIFTSNVNNILPNSIVFFSGTTGTIEIDGFLNNLYDGYFNYRIMGNESEYFFNPYQYVKSKYYVKSDGYFFFRFGVVGNFTLNTGIFNVTLNGNVLNVTSPIEEKSLNVDNTSKIVISITRINNDVSIVVEDASGEKEVLLKVSSKPISISKGCVVIRIPR